MKVNHIPKDESCYLCLRTALGVSQHGSSINCRCDKQVSLSEFLVNSVDLELCFVYRGKNQHFHDTCKSRDPAEKLAIGSGISLKPELCMLAAAKGHCTSVLLYSLSLSS